MQIERLLSYMQNDWKSRANGDGNEILKKYAERGRLFSISYICESITTWSMNLVIYYDSWHFFIWYTTDYLYISTGLYVGVPIVPVVLDLVVPLNESRPPLFPFKAEYFVDENDYFTLVVLHGFLVGYTSMSVIIGVDAMYSVQLHYACGMFAELGWVSMYEVCSKNKGNFHFFRKIFIDSWIFMLSPSK